MYSEHVVDRPATNFCRIPLVHLSMWLMSQLAAMTLIISVFLMMERPSSAVVCSRCWSFKTLPTISTSPILTVRYLQKATAVLFHLLQMKFALSLMGKIIFFSRNVLGSKINKWSSGFFITYMGCKNSQQISYEIINTNILLSCSWDFSG